MSQTRRTYTMRKRAQAAEETRLSIIEAARRLLSDASYHDVSLDELAGEAGVSRQTIYVQFGSKRGVLQGLAEHIERETYGQGMLAGVAGVSDPVRTIRGGLNDLMAFFGLNADLLRTFHAQAATDPDFGAVWQDRQQERWEAIHYLVEWAARDSRLAPEWDVEEATDWLWSLTNFQRYDEMVMQRGWSPERLIHHLEKAVDAVLPAWSANTSEERAEGK